jgi:hypothetical protein
VLRVANEFIFSFTPHMKFKSKNTLFRNQKDNNVIITGQKFTHQLARNRFSPITQLHKLSITFGSLSLGSYFIMYHNSIYTNYKQITIKLLLSSLWCFVSIRTHIHTHRVLIVLLFGSSNYKYTYGVGAHHHQCTAHQWKARVHVSSCLSTLTLAHPDCWRTFSPYIFVVSTFNYTYIFLLWRHDFSICRWVI